MNENLNLVEILKNCPKGTKFYSSYLGKDVFFIEIYNNCVECEYSSQIDFSNCITHFKKDGSLYPGGDCMLFPSKDQRDWSKWHRPFVDGDILFYKHKSNNIKYTFIYKRRIDMHYLLQYCGWFSEKPYLSEQFNVKERMPLYENDNIRFATDEEKQELFDAIKSHGYKWNAKSKTLEKLEDMEDKGNISDGYHTFNELYEYRLLYNASMFNELAKQGLYDVHKSKKHSDGTIPFGDENWFIVQAELPTGQISNHYEMKDWDLFQIPEKERANPYDGHTPKDVAKRLRDFLTLDKSITPKFKDEDNMHSWTIQDAKDGDVIFYDDGWTCIFKCIHGIWYSSYCFITSDGGFHTGYEEHAVDSKINGNAHLATKEQCNLLFQKIKEAGYKWCTKTKTLKKRPKELKFKLGDKIKQKGSPQIHIISSIEFDRYILNNNQFIRFTDENIYELVPVEPKFKVGDTIRSKNGLQVYTITGVTSEYYSSKIQGNDCVEVLPVKEQDNYELLPNKFDPKTLKPFDKVLIRPLDHMPWYVDFCSCYIEDKGYIACTGGLYYTKGIPYNDDTKHLVGKSEDAPKFYRYWEE